MALFQFRQFCIDDSQCAMKIGTDGVLLGAWAFNGRCPREILDIGAGSGLLSLMMAQRFTESKITGIEIVPSAAEIARSNIESSPWGNRIEILNENALAYHPHRQFEAIISNPPFYNEAIKPADEKRKLARHGQELNIESLILVSKELLKENGYLAFIAPAHRSDEIVYLLTLNHLDTERITFVSPKYQAEPNRVLIEAIKGTARQYRNETLFIRQHGGQYSPQYKDLTQSFYLETTFK